MAHRQFKLPTYYRLRGIIGCVQGAALIEFAIVANLLIAINILAYDFASYYRLSEQVKHATQFIHTALTSDADHKITIRNLEQKLLYIAAVTGKKDFNSTSALVAIDAMPLYSPSLKQWSLIVCWSWSSNALISAAPAVGSHLSATEYSVEPWISQTATTANSALLILETYVKNDRLFPTSLIPEMSNQHMIGPIRYASTMPLNLMLYETEGGKLLNESKIQEMTGARAILCQR